MIAAALMFLRLRGIGKSEIGLFLHFLVLMIYVLPIVPQMDWEVHKAVHTIVGAFTLSGFLGRIEKMETVIKAFKSIFGVWGKKSGGV